VPLPQAPDLWPAVARLAEALADEDRPATETAAQGLATGLARALGLPPVRVQVLAARPHAKWGELHGLYESSGRREQAPLITLWMRTARQKRVVAFRTFLRTLLHEVGHHLDFTLLRLGDSLHTQGFYARESHLFHQLVTDGGITMATLEEQLARLERTPQDLATAIEGAPEPVLGRRPDPKNWAPKEVLCHVRDTEEAFMTRFQTIMAMDEPKLLAADPERWAADRQYLRNDAGEALAAFGKRRGEALAFFRGLKPPQWERAGIHPTRGRMSLKDFAAFMVWHDDNHLDQLRRALDGKV
jgi:DinB family protein